MRLGRKLLLRITATAMSAREIARMTGLAESTISSLRSGSRIAPDIDTAIALAEVTGIRVEWWARKFEDVDESNFTHVKSDGDIEPHEVKST